MASLFKQLAPVFSVVAILAVFLWDAGVLPSQSGLRQLGISALGMESPEPKSQPAQQLGEFMADVEGTLMSLNTARLNLLRTAAQSSDDPDALHAAAMSYRESIVQLRSKIEELDDKRGTDDRDTLVRTMMSDALPLTQRVLSAEVFGVLDKPATVLAK